MRSLPVVLTAIVSMVTACSSTSSQLAATTTSILVSDTDVDSDDGWEALVHPVVVAVRGSASAEPASRALDGSEATSWVSGDNPTQWIEFDLGEPVDISSITLIVDQEPTGFTVHEIRAGAHDNPGRLAARIEGETSDGDRLRAEVGYEAEFVRITTLESPSWVAWTEIEIILE